MALAANATQAAQDVAKTETAADEAYEQHVLAYSEALGPYRDSLAAFTQWMLTLRHWLGLALGAVIPRDFGSLTGFMFLLLPLHRLIHVCLLLPLPPPFTSGIIVLVTFVVLACHLYFVEVFWGLSQEMSRFRVVKVVGLFLMTDLGPLRYFLGIEVSSTSDGFYISQEKYIQDLLTRAALGDERTIETPMELNVHLCATDGDPLPDPTRYRHLVGSLVYLAVTRLDISYHVHILSQFMSAPTSVHYSHLLHVLRYLRGTISSRLFFPRSSSLQLQTYLDVMWAVRDV
ncbi:hypothetical protein QYE76_046276 [Lolium multiflorum]|uniref:Reverse transcriptase Ty1/copia-type domain-containing protein n=1 Tax=Lolium multiflorum TaxID=4521 RepID=A0AAD8X0X9_LOLMU|nr:hypothetical protein QYE76_046276 [Lolium multiflorum]